MMKNLKLSLTLILLAALSLGSMQTIKPSPQQKQTLLQRLVMQFKINRDLIRQSQIHAFKLPKAKIAQLRAERRKILKRIAAAGLTAAFLAAIGTAVAVGVAAKKRGERGKAPAGPPLTFKRVHEEFRPPGMAPPHERKKGIRPEDPRSFVAEEELFDRPTEWDEAERKAKQRKSFIGTLRPEPPEYREVREGVPEALDDPEVLKIIEKIEKNE